jgi:hypothetical protein
MLPYIMKRGKELITSALPMGQGVNAVADIVYSDNYRDKQITKELTSAAFKQAKSGVKRGLNKAKEVSAPIADYIDDLIGSNELWDKDSQ